MPVEVANESEIAVDEGELAGVCRFVLGEMKVNPMAELSVLCVDVDYMSSLHERWMGEKGPTDVLAFPMDEGSVDHGPGEAGTGEPALLGDIVLCPSVAVRQARAAGHSMDDELVLLADEADSSIVEYGGGTAGWKECDGEEGTTPARISLVAPMSSTQPPSVDSPTASTFLSR